MRPIIPLFTLLTLIALGCNTQPGTSHETAKPPCCRTAPPKTPLPDRSIYQLESEWTSDMGKQIRLGQLQGHPLVVGLFFSHCEYACPILVNDMKRIEAALPAGAGDEVEFLLVSIDPDRDTPERLQKYRAEKSLSPRRWTLLTGTEDDVRELAAILGVNYQRDSRGQYTHSNLITLLSPKGEILTQSQGLNQPIDALIRRAITTKKSE